MRSLTLFVALTAASLIAESAVSRADDPCQAVHGFLTAGQIANCLRPTKGIRVGEEIESPRIDLQAVTFEFNSAKLTQQARDQLDELAKALSYATLSASTFTIAGHTDAVGSDAYNQALSEARADAVRQYLGEHAVTMQRMSTVGYGERRLRPDLDPTADEQRRVEIKLDPTN